MGVNRLVTHGPRKNREAAVLRGDERPLPVETLRSIPEPLDWRQHVTDYDDLLTEVAERHATPVAVAT